ncbi:MAG: hydrogenase nickel incorporation protein HypB [Halodesulfurarchaeum sp.]
MYYELPTGSDRIATPNHLPVWADRIETVLERLLGPVRAHRLGHEDFGADVSGAAAEADVLAAIRERAGELHETLVHDHGVFTVEFVGSTGGGKTRLIEELLERAPAEETIGAIVGDVAGEDDATRLREYGIQVENINTGKECHLDPDGVGSVLTDFDLHVLETLYVENVGNMVCPADFPLGASLRILVVSTTEGDDVVAKHPLLVQSVDAAVINKTDLAAAVGTDLDRLRDDIDRAAPDLPVFETNAKDGVGVDALRTFLESHRGTGHGHDHAHAHAMDGHGHEQSGHTHD